MIRVDEIEHAADCCAFLAEQVETQHPQIAALLDEAMWLLGTESAIEDISLHELACAVEDAGDPETNIEQEEDTVTALLDLRFRIDAALRGYQGWQPWELGRITALCQIATAVLDPDGGVRVA